MVVVMAPLVLVGKINNPDESLSFFVVVGEVNNPDESLPFSVVVREVNNPDESLSFFVVVGEVNNPDDSLSFSVVETSREVSSIEMCDIFIGLLLGKFQGDYHEGNIGILWG